MQGIVDTPEYMLALDSLKAATVRWAGGHRLNWPEITRQRRRVLELNHRHYFEKIPAYRRLCEREGVGSVASVETILQHSMISDDIFKSYPQELLDRRDFRGMNHWLAQISTFTVDETESIVSIDEWIQSLAEKDLHLVFSSGTSGQMSFVPRDQRTWSAFMEVPYLYLPQLLARRGVISRFKSFLLRVLAIAVRPDRFALVVKRFGMRDIDGFFMNFSGGNQGIQLVGQEAGKLTRRAHYLYRADMSASAVRALVRGPRDEGEERVAQSFLQATVHDKANNYERIIAELASAAKKGRRVVLFGTPYLIKELCEKVWLKCGQLKLARGSHVIYGGGWKSFDGARIPENELLSLIENTFAIDKSSVLEGYSMTEINGLLAKCEAGRYHLPPYLEARILGEDLKVKDAPTGTLALLDPFAISYPGFLITGDNVHLTSERCPCGLEGETVLQVERAPSREVKGCGGIMATINM